MLDAGALGEVGGCDVEALLDAPADPGGCSLVRLGGRLAFLGALGGIAGGLLEEDGVGRARLGLDRGDVLGASEEGDGCVAQLGLSKGREGTKEEAVVGVDSLWLAGSLDACGLLVFGCRQGRRRKETRKSRREEKKTDSSHPHQKHPASPPSSEACPAQHPPQCSTAARAPGVTQSRARCTGRSQAPCWGCRAAWAGSAEEEAHWSIVSWQCSPGGSCVRRRLSIVRTTCW